MVGVHNAYSAGGIPLTVQAIGNLKVTTDPAYTRNAIERLLSMNTREIGAVAQQTLEGVCEQPYAVVQQPLVAGVVHPCLLQLSELLCT